jgi:hypothetical protein
MWCCFEAKGILFFRIDIQIVGWVEQSETHQIEHCIHDGFRFALPILQA